ncbi:MAG: permease [Albidovulum sp.]|nr:permease [Albidovulum sp.]MDE0533634.1 permease [Albidovulum sp.]
MSLKSFEIFIPLSENFKRIDPVWAASALVLLSVGTFASSEFLPVIDFAADAMAHTGVFIAVAVAMVAYLKASGAESIVAKAFLGHEAKMVVFASLLGGLAPFCSCEVIPFIAALLAAGTPLSAVMAFWLSSPIMDPPMFMITASKLGFDFAAAKTLAAVGFGLLGGFGTMAFNRTSYFSSALKTTSIPIACCNSSKFSGQPLWKFWKEQGRILAFRESTVSNALFLLKWMILAYLLEALMIRFIPTELVVSVLGGEGLRPVLLGALIGGPAYLNGYAAVPVVAGMLEQGMSQGAAMAFVLAGSVTCIPAAVAVWALVRARIFLAYLTFAIIGSVAGGVLWAAVA